MSYEKFATNYHRYTHAPRTLSEAFRDADYGTAIWRCETQQEKGRDALLFVLALMFFGFIIGLFIAPILS